MGEQAEPPGVQELGRPSLKRCARVAPHESPPPRSSLELARTDREAEGCAVASAGAGAAVAKGETPALQVRRAGAGAAKQASADPLT